MSNESDAKKLMNDLSGAIPGDEWKYILAFLNARDSKPPMSECESGCEGTGFIRITNNGKGRQDRLCPSGCAPKPPMSEGERRGHEA
jgi:hypothetical protein